MQRLALPRLSSLPLLLLIYCPILAGPLSPPNAPAPTAKPLAEIEPRIAINAANTPGDADSVYRITQAGSYYLTGNLAGEGFKSGIEIALGQSGEVTIDLAGFQLRGAADTFSGIDISGAFSPILNIRNGGVVGWDGHGIDLTGMEGGVIEGVSLLNNYGTGLIVSGAIVRDCTATVNNGGGFNIGDGTTITNCVARNNTGVGIDSNSNCVIVGCTASGNTGHGMEGFLNTVVESSTANNNSGCGISMNTGATIIKCTARANTLNGIQAVSAGVITDCMAYDNTQVGIYTSLGGTISNCVASVNSSNGFAVGGNATISNSTAISNSSHGIGGGGGNLITNCSVLYNDGAGIHASLNGNTIRGNHCTGNGQGGTEAGIHVVKQFSRVEDNTCIENDIGIDVDDSRNVIVRNMCQGNTTVNWSIAAGNVVGPILDRIASGAGAISGNSAASSLGTTDANANFTY
jgi:parallel beta-helix repeat protein